MTADQTTDINTLPQHIAIIMDGNGRWANNRGLPRLKGHQKGSEAVRDTIEAARDLGVQYLTLFAFSSENWKRPEDEVSGLMNLLRYYLKREMAELQKTGVCLKVIGEHDRLDQDLRDMIAQAVELTKDNDDMVVTVALNYGGRRDIVLAAREMAARVQSGEITIDDITEKSLQSALMTADLPEPDFVIRTSGEQRLSNFLMWQFAYTEIYFTDVLWPDFGKKDLEKALKNYALRKRRFGALPQEAAE